MLDPPNEVLVAIIAGMALVVGATASGSIGYFTARYQAQRMVRQSEADFLADRDRLLWEQAHKFWDERAGALTNEVELERAARKAGEAALSADIALLKQDNANLRREHVECHEHLKELRDRLIRAGEQLAIQE